MLLQAEPIDWMDERTRREAYRLMNVHYAGFRQESSDMLQRKAERYGVFCRQEIARAIEARTPALAESYERAALSFAQGAHECWLAKCAVDIWLAQAEREWSQR